MKNFALFARKPQSTASVDAARRGPTLIDPKDFKHVGGGLPNGTWRKGAAATQLPNGTW